jgi:hypothetical protein
MKMNESVEVKSAWIYSSNPPIRLHGVMNLKHRENFTFTLPFPDELAMVVTRDEDHVRQFNSVFIPWTGSDTPRIRCVF